MNPEKVTYFGETDSRNKRAAFGIKAKDRTRHVYVIGKTGMGKSTVLENMAVQDIQNGEGMAFVDPHGKSADLLLEYVPQERIKDVIYFAPFDTDYPISFNVMEDVGVDKRHLVANGLMSAFKKIWVDAWSARMEYILNNILLALLEYPDSTLVGVNRMLSDKAYRKLVVSNVSDPSVKSFWIDEFEKYGERYMQEAGAAIQNKVGQFVSNPLVRNIIGQAKSNFDLRKVMDDRKIVIVNLSKGRVGEQNANLLGSMLITKIYLSAMSRADSSESILKNLPNFYLYVDEFQSFANESFADILSEARKYKLNLTIAHQYIEQMSEEVRAAVFGNVGTMITFRVGAYDAEVLEKEFAPVFTAEDLVNLGSFQIYLKLMIDGVSSAPFSAATMMPIPKPQFSFKHDIIESSRAAFATPRSEVEEAIKKWHEDGAKGPGAISKDASMYKPMPKSASVSTGVSTSVATPAPVPATYKPSSIPVSEVKKQEFKATPPPTPSPASTIYKPTVPVINRNATPTKLPEERSSMERRDVQAPSVSIPLDRRENGRRAEDSRDPRAEEKKQKQEIFESIMTQERQKQIERNTPTSISLQTLKPDLKRNDKQATPQHVSDLKKALETLTAAAKQPQVSTPPASEKKVVDIPKIILQTTSQQTQQVPIQEKFSAQIPEVKKEVPLPSQKEQKQKLQEIPEAELLDLLRVDL